MIGIKVMASILAIAWFGLITAPVNATFLEHEQQEPAELKRIEKELAN
jgi:ferric iron reductase protein FhuF